MAHYLLGPAYGLFHADNNDCKIARPQIAALTTL